MTYGYLMDVITYLKRIRHLIRTNIYYHTEKFGKKTILVKGRKFIVEVADTVKKRRLGLMYRNSIKKNEGMIFVYGDDSKHSIWMFNTRFRLDIIWLNNKKKVVDMFENAEPCKSIFDCPLHLSKRISRYTLELPKGSIKEMNLKIGNTIRF